MCPALETRFEGLITAGIACEELFFRKFPEYKLTEPVYKTIGRLVMKLFMLRLMKKYVLPFI